MRPLHFLAGITVALVAAALLPRPAAATDCAFSYEGEQADLVPVSLSVDDTPGDATPFTEYAWHLATDVNGDLMLQLESSTGVDLLYMDRDDDGGE